MIYLCYEGILIKFCCFLYEKHLIYNNYTLQGHYFLSQSDQKQHQKQTVSRATVFSRAGNPISSKFIPQTKNNLILLWKMFISFCFKVMKRLSSWLLLKDRSYFCFKVIYGHVCVSNITTYNSVEICWVIVRLVSGTICQVKKQKRMHNL